MVLMSRPGTLEAPLNTMSRLTNGLYADLTTVIEAKPLYQRTNGVISDNYVYILRPQLGYLITSVLSCLIRLTKFPFKKCFLKDQASLNEEAFLLLLQKNNHKQKYDYEEWYI